MSAKRSFVAYSSRSTNEVECTNRQLQLAQQRSQNRNHQPFKRLLKRKKRQQESVFQSGLNFVLNGTNSSNSYNNNRTRKILFEKQIVSPRDDPPSHPLNKHKYAQSDPNKIFKQSKKNFPPFFSDRPSPLYINPNQNKTQKSFKTTKNLQNYTKNIFSFLFLSKSNDGIPREKILQTQQMRKNRDYYLKDERESLAKTNLLSERSQLSWKKINFLASQSKDLLFTLISQKNLQTKPLRFLTSASLPRTPSKLYKMCPECVTKSISPNHLELQNTSRNPKLSLRSVYKLKSTRQTKHLQTTHIGPSVESDSTGSDYLSTNTPEDYDKEKKIKKMKKINKVKKNKNKKVLFKGKLTSHTYRICMCKSGYKLDGFTCRKCECFYPADFIVSH